MDLVVISPWADDAPPTLDVLLESSLAEGHRLVARTVEEWNDGTNTFSRPGEAFIVATTDRCVVGICGLNIDPFEDDPSIGRLRHLYVLPAYRRRGIGRQLVDACLSGARGRFERIRLRTPDRGAADFYEAVGFHPVDEDGATHTLSL